MEKVAILFGSSTGNTESIAQTLAEKIGENIAEAFNVSDFSVSRLAEYNNLILGVSTLGIGAIQDHWKDFLPKLARADLNGKTIALFGLGDTESYPDTFVDGMGIVYEAIRKKGCTIIGQVDTIGYSFEHSGAVYEGKFIGLPLDEDNESELTPSRIENWLNEITAKFI
ncbi:MAG: flavodoxin [Bacteroidales bacterium]|nr:flavodoxin [Bacteroidales bacterium]